MDFPLISRYTDRALNTTGVGFGDLNRLRRMLRHLADFLRPHTLLLCAPLMGGQ